MSITFTIDIRAMQAAAAAVGTEHTRYYLMGVCVEHTPTGPVFIATDGSRLIAARHDWLDDAGAPAAFAPVIVPIDLIKRVKVAKRDPNEATLTFDYRDGDHTPHVTITHAGAATTSGAIDGTFPGWRHVIPRDPASGVPAQYNCDLLASFRKAIKALGAPDALPSIAYNGESPALVDLGDHGRVQAFGVVMPFRIRRDVLTAAPAWADYRPAPTADAA